MEHFYFWPNEAFVRIVTEVETKYGGTIPEEYSSLLGQARLITEQKAIDLITKDKTAFLCISNPSDKIKAFHKLKWEL